MPSDRRFWVPTVVTALLFALAAVVQALLQGRLASIPVVVGGAVVLVVIYLTQSVLEQRRRRTDDTLTWLTPEALERQSALSRADLIEQMRDLTASELDRSLGRLADMQLGFALAPDAVEYVLRRPNEPDLTVTTGSPIRDLYDRIGHQMLLLGEPGAGKTTLLFQLARPLLEEAERTPEARVPVVFRLPSWAVERRPLDEWLTTVLSRDYGVSPRLGRLWVETEQVIPLLDGLDEVEEQHRTACLDAINRFEDEHGQLPIVVCSRVQEYEELPARLRLRGAVAIQPLDREDVLAYLERARQPGLRAALEQDEGLCQLLTTPLLLSIAALTYQGQPTPPTHLGGTLIERRRRVLDDYVHAMVHSRAGDAGSRFEPETVVGTLSWLARAMRAHSQTVFHVDRVQPDWLPTERDRTLAPALATAAAFVLHLMVVALAAGVAVAAVVLLGGRGSLLEVPAGLLPGLVPLAPLALAAGVALAMLVHDVAIEPIRWSPDAFRGTLPAAVLRGAVAGPVLGAAAALLTLSPDVLRPAFLWIVVVGALVGLLTSLGFAIAAGHRASMGGPPANPGADIEGLLRTARFGALVGPLVLCPMLAMVSAVALHLATGKDAPPVIAIVVVFVALPLSLFSALRLGGAAYLRHRAVLWLLSRAGLAPRNLVDFLAHAARLNLLRRQGGGYEFVHPLLRQRFAELDDPEPEQRVSRTPAGAPPAPAS